MHFQHKFFQKIIALTAVLLTAAVISCTVSPMRGFAAGKVKGTVSVDALNVRKDPGTDNPVINVLYKGDAVEILKTEKGWHRISQGKNKYGWVSSEYISVGKETAKKETSKKKKTEAAPKKTTAEKDTAKATVTGSYVNFRKGPGSGYGVIKKIAYGTTGTILQKKGSWYKIRLKNGKEGWVTKKYVKVTGDGELSESSSKADEKKSNKIVVVASSVNVRTTPSTSGKLITAVRRNEVYTYSEIKDGWYKIVTPSGESGYINEKYVKGFKSYAVDGGGKYLWPTQTATRISQRFGVGNHKGMDIAAPGGSQIIAVADGTVCSVAYHPRGFGHLIVIKQNDGIKAYYAHMKKPTFLKKGDKVKAGDTIGIVGTTGKSTGNHIHLEFRRGDERIDPLTYYPNLG